MRVFTIACGQPERISQGMPRYDHGDGTQEEERRFGGSLDHRIAVRTNPLVTTLDICLRPILCERKIGHHKGSGQGPWFGGWGQNAELTGVLTFGILTFDLHSLFLILHSDF